MSMFAAIVLGEELEKMTRRAEAAEAALATMIEQKEYFRQCWEAAEAALADRDKPCVHTLRDGWIDTECGTSSSIVRDWEFCPYCGHPVEVAP